MKPSILPNFITGNIQISCQENRKSPAKPKRLTEYWQDGPFNIAQDEESLWKAVIMQALVDATTCQTQDDSARSRLEAMRWLTNNNPDFLDVCLRACLDPNQVRVMAKKAIANPGVWRITAGKSLRYLERKAMRARKRMRQAIQKPETAPTTLIISLF